MTTSIDEREGLTATDIRDAAAPLAPAAASFVAAFLAVAVTALGLLGVREALVTLGWIQGETWLLPAMEALDGVTPTWTSAAGSAVAVVGALLMIAALKPRRHTTLRADARTAVYVEFPEVARLATVTAESVPGVVTARSTATRRVVTVRCAVTGSADAGVDGAVADAVKTELGALQPRPRVRVRMTRGDR